MAIRLITTNTLVTAAGADAITVASFDSIIVQTGVLVGASGPVTGGNFSYGIYGAPSVGPVDVQVFGTVFGTAGAILLNDAFLRQSVHVGGTGQLYSEFIALIMTGSLVDIQNEGLIRGIGSGVSTDALSITRLVNSGSIIGLSGYGVEIQSGAAKIVNTGTIRGDVAAIFHNGMEDVTIWNSGLINGTVALGGGDDLYQGGGQVLNGFITGGSGRDTIIGGAGDEAILDQDGGDWLAGGGGADTIFLGYGTGLLSASHVFGGASGGADASSEDTIAIAGIPVGANIFLSTGTAVGSVTRSTDNAVVAFITGFENATGSVFADAIFGSSAANVIEGGNGADWMVGNGGGDRFVFRSALDADAGDQIRDFRRSEGDRIDLAAIDANTASAADDAFVFRTTRTNNAAAEAVITNFGNSARVDLYNNADNIVDGTFIVVYGEAGVTNLQASDFLL